MSSDTSTSNNNADNRVVGNHYNVSTSDKNTYSTRPLSFNGDSSQFFWWKNNMYSHIIGDDDHLDILDDGVTFEIDSKEMVTDIKSLIDAKKDLEKASQSPWYFF